MHSITKAFLIVSITLAILASLSYARPTEQQNSILRVKRQSDQRLAELETLLALQKYGINRHRADHTRHSAGLGLVDFNVIGRRKKSLRFSPGIAQQDPQDQQEILSSPSENRLSSFLRNTRDSSNHHQLPPTLQTESQEESLEQQMLLSSIEFQNK